MVSVVVVSAAFLQYILDDPLIAKHYLKISLAFAVVSYLATFLWWAHYITHHPASKFGQVWCDWVFHIIACILIAYAFSRIIEKSGWIGAVVGTALFLFFLDEFLKLVDLLLAERYEDILAPVRHSLHLLAILLLAYVYWQEQLLERRRLEKRVLEISDLEKRKIGQDLHDGLIQQLTGVLFFTDLLTQKIANGELPKHKECKEVTGHLQDAISQARLISRGLYPVELERAGLQMAVEELVQANSQLYGLPCVFHCKSETNQYSIETTTHIYRILQEAVSNAARHAGASEIIVDVYQDHSHTVFEIRDDGRGVDIQDVQRGMGMQTMRYRASLIQADLITVKRDGGGHVHPINVSVNATMKSLNRNKGSAQMSDQKENSGKMKKKISVYAAE